MVISDTQVIVSAVSYCAGLVAWSFVLHKMGYRFWVFLCVLVPVVNIVTVLYIAFAKWPVLKELAKLKEQKQGG